MAPNVPAVVVGGSLNGLGVLRSLAGRRIPLYLVETTRCCPAAWSRHATFVRAPRLDGDALIEVLISLATKLGCRPVLILTLDPSVLTVSASRKRLAEHYRIELPEPDIVSALADKLAFQQWAEREGFPVPRSRSVRNLSELEQLGELTPPVVLKPADKCLVLANVVERAVRAESIDEARLVAIRMLQRAPALIAQEWIEGPDSQIYFTLFCADPTSRSAAIFPGRKLVCSPPAVGTTAVCVAAPEVADTLDVLTRTFIERTRYRGLGSLEFKRDSRTGHMLTVEPTVGRTDWQEEIAALCAVNLPLIAYQSALGQAPPTVVLGPMLPAWRSERRFRLPHEELSRTRIIDGHFRWNDPLPAAYYYGYERLVRRVFRRALRGIRSKMTYITGAL